MRSGLGFVSLAVLALVAVGCGSDSQGPLSPPQVTLPPNNFDPNIDAGWKQIVVGDTKLVADLKNRQTGEHGQSFAMRNDPFALMPEERRFEASQASERVLGEAGWRFDYVPPEVKDETPVTEPQPYRRLAGVIVGESVLALIDMGDGRPLEIIRPGQRIPNSEWTVVSIDEDKAILRRPGNKLPKEISVRLESPPFNPNQGGGAPGGMGGGQDVGGGAPGGGKSRPGGNGVQGGGGGPGRGTPD